MIRMQAIVTTPWGDFKAPKRMTEMFKACQLRNDGMPDRRTIKGREWWEEYVAFVGSKWQTLSWNVPRPESSFQNPNGCSTKQEGGNA